MSNINKIVQKLPYRNITPIIGQRSQSLTECRHRIHPFLRRQWTRTSSTDNGTGYLRNHCRFRMHTTTKSWHGPTNSCKSYGRSHHESRIRVQKRQRQVQALCIYQYSVQTTTTRSSRGKLRLCPA